MSTARVHEPGTDERSPLRQVCAFTAWVGAGRPLTQTGRVRLADARELVALLGTGDELDPLDGRFKTASSAELDGLTLVVEWAKACRLVRVQRGRLVPVKKHEHLLREPAQLWARMFEVFGRLGETLCPDGWGQSLLRWEFEAALGAVLAETCRRGGTIAIADAHELAWQTAAAPYRLDGAPELHRRTWRTMHDRDLHRALELLQRFGAVQLRGDALSLTAQGNEALRRARGDALPGDAVLQLKISLRRVADPPVWRRVLVPASITLDRLHDVIQAAMGWHDSHLHAFTAGRVEYGVPDPELNLRDERKARLIGLAAKPGARLGYTYDFGDDWEHEILVEKVLSAQAGARYPVCTGGTGRRPPEDCGGVWGYASLRETLADPGHPEHEAMLDWLGIDAAGQFDPAAFDVDEVNAAL